MLTFEQANRTLNRISYKPGWLVAFREHTADIWMMWACFTTVDALDGVPISLESRVWYVTPTFSEDDLIQTAFMMIKQTEEHELMEFFKVDGIAPFNPHIPISAHMQAFRETIGAKIGAADSPA